MQAFASGVTAGKLRTFWPYIALMVMINLIIIDALLKVYHYESDLDLWESDFKYASFFFLMTGAILWLRLFGINWASIVLHIATMLALIVLMAVNYSSMEPFTFALLAAPVIFLFLIGLPLIFVNCAKNVSYRKGYTEFHSQLCFLVVIVFYLLCCFQLKNAGHFISLIVEMIYFVLFLLINLLPGSKERTDSSASVDPRPIATMRASRPQITPTPVEHTRKEEKEPVLLERVIMEDQPLRQKQFRDQSYRLSDEPRRVHHKKRYSARDSPSPKRSSGRDEPAPKRRHKKHSVDPSGGPYDELSDDERKLVEAMYKDDGRSSRPRKYAPISRKYRSREMARGLSPHSSPEEYVPPKRYRAPHKSRPRHAVSYYDMPAVEPEVWKYRAPKHLEGAAAVIVVSEDEAERGVRPWHRVTKYEEPPYLPYPADDEPPRRFGRRFYSDEEIGMRRMRRRAPQYIEKEPELFFMSEEEPSRRKVRRYQTISDEDFYARGIKERKLQRYPSESRLYIQRERARSTERYESSEDERESKYQWVKAVNVREKDGRVVEKYIPITVDEDSLPKQSSFDKHQRIAMLPSDEEIYVSKYVCRTPHDMPPLTADERLSCRFEEDGKRNPQCQEEVVRCAPESILMRVVKDRKGVPAKDTTADRRPTTSRSYRAADHVTEPTSTKYLKTKEETLEEKQRRTTQQQAAATARATDQPTCDCGPCNRDVEQCIQKIRSSISKYVPEESEACGVRASDLEDLKRIQREREEEERKRAESKRALEDLRREAGSGGGSCNRDVEQCMHKIKSSEESEACGVRASDHNDLKRIQQERDEEERKRAESKRAMDDLRQEAERNRIAREAIIRKLSKEEEQRRAEQEYAVQKARKVEEKMRAEHERIAKKLRAEEDRKRRWYDCAIKKARKNEEKKRIAHERAAQKARLKEEKKRIKHERIMQKVRDAGERKRLEHERAIQKVCEEEEKKRIAHERETQKVREYEQRLRIAHERALHKVCEQTEMKRLTEERATLKTRKEEERRRIAHERAKQKLFEAQEQKRITQEIIDRKLQALEEERQRIAYERAVQDASADDKRHRTAYERALKYACSDEDRQRIEQEHGLLRSYSEQDVRKLIDYELDTISKACSEQKKGLYMPKLSIPASKICDDELPSTSKGIRSNESYVVKKSDTDIAADLKEQDKGRYVATKVPQYKDTCDSIQKSKKD